MALHIKSTHSLFQSVALQTVTMTLPFIHLFCRKSTLVSTLLENVTVMIELKIVKVLFCYSLGQPNYNCFRPKTGTFRLTSMRGYLMQTKSHFLVKP